MSPARPPDRHHGDRLQQRDRHDQHQHQRHAQYGHRRQPGAALGHCRFRTRPRRCRSPIRSSFPPSTISFDLAPGASLGDAVAAIARRRTRSACRRPSSAAVPATRRSSTSRSPASPGSFSRRSSSIYVVLGVLYESFIHPFTILSTLPSAGVGALLALMLFG